MKRRHAGLAAYAEAIALSAYGGVTALATGAMDTEARIDPRLPFRSPVVGAMALATIVGVPNTVLAWFTWHADPRITPAALVAGTLLVAWIAGEVAIIQQVSWLQSLYVAVGMSLIAVDYRFRSRGHASTAP